MSRWNRRQAPEQSEGAEGFTGVVRFARPGDPTAKSLREGDIAVIDVGDLDRGQAEALVEAKVRAVVNASPSSSGRYPNLGPRVLADAGIGLVDGVGEGIWSRVRNGDTVRVQGDRIFKDDVLVAQGVRQDDKTVTAQLGAAEAGLSTRLGSLTANASDHLERERAMLLEGARVPHLAKKLRKRPTVVVSRTHDWRRDLDRITRWIRQQDAVLIGVGAGADALLDAKLQPDVVVGSLDDLSDKALRSGADVVVTTSSPLEARGNERFEKAGVDVSTFVASGAPSDLALILADSNEAPVIVEVGAAPDLVALLDRGAAEVASTFVTRLRAGTKLVDAKAVGHMVGRPMPVWPVLLVLLAGVAAVVAAIATTSLGQEWWQDLTDLTTDGVSDARTWIEGLFS